MPRASRRLVSPLSTLAVLSMTALPSCATALTPSGQKVEIGKGEPSNCKMLGPVYGTGGGADYTNSETKLSSAQNDMRNRAAKMGATYVVMDAVGSDAMGMTMSGRAYQCDGPPSVGEAKAAPASPPALSAEDRLTNLKALLDKGLITQAEYDKRRAEILQSL